MNSIQHTVARWRDEAGLDNPAGSLFAGGEFAAADIVSASQEISVLCTGNCSTCSGSTPVNCC